LGISVTAVQKPQDAAGEQTSQLDQDKTEKEGGSRWDFGGEIYLLFFFILYCYNFGVYGFNYFLANIASLTLSVI
jgi:hypothetical protein